MTVNTKTVTGRRHLRYDRVEDILADAERLAQGEVVTIGNWSFGQILEHIARVMRGGIEGIPVTVPWWMRVILPLMKKRVLSRMPPAGFKLPPDAEKILWPTTDCSVEQGLQSLREATRLWQENPTRQVSPFLGQLSNAEWDQLQMRHAELHMSFVKPAEQVEGSPVKTAIKTN